MHHRQKCNLCPTALLLIFYGKYGSMACQLQTIGSALYNINQAVLHRFLNRLSVVLKYQCTDHKRRKDNEQLEQKK